MTTDYRQTIERGRAWVAERGDRVIGLLVLEVRQDHLLLENVAVLPEAQGLGVGRRLLLLAQEQARAHGLREVRLYTNEAMVENHDYYRRHGYRETHRGTDGGFRRVYYSKVLV